MIPLYFILSFQRRSFNRPEGSLKIQTDVGHVLRDLTDLMSKDPDDVEVDHRESWFECRTLWNETDHGSRCHDRMTVYNATAADIQRFLKLTQPQDPVDSD